MSPNKQRCSKMRHWAQTCCCLFGHGYEQGESGGRPSMERPPGAQPEAQPKVPPEVPPKAPPEALSTNSEATPTCTALPPKETPSLRNLGSGSVSSNNTRIVDASDIDKGGQQAITQAEASPWGEALDRLKTLSEDSKAAQAALQLVGRIEKPDTHGSDSRESSAKEIKRLMEAISDEKAEKAKESLKVRINGEEYSVREYVDKAVALMDKFAVLGDIAASIDPIHAALPWAAVRYFIMALNSNIQLGAKIDFGLATITTLIFQCDMYQRLYNSARLPSKEHEAILSQLCGCVVESYVRSLMFLGFAYQQHETSRAKAPLKLHEVEEYVQGVLDAERNLVKSADDCDKHCNHLNQANVIEILELMRSSHKTIQLNEARLVDIQQHAGLSTLETALKTAKNAKYNSYAQQDNPKCHKNTRVDLLEEIQTWAHDSESRSIFWLQGMAGTGKSTISRTVAETLDLQGELGASFFFKRGEGDRSSAEYLITTICYQLCEKYYDFAQEIQTVIKSSPKIAEGFTNEQFNKLITEPLNNIASNTSHSSTVVVVIDALDECDQENDVKRIINLLSGAKDEIAVHNLKFFITSRPELHIRIGFNNIGNRSHQGAILHEIPPGIVEGDISTYLTHELDRIRDNYNGNQMDKALCISHAWPGQESIDKLVKMSVPLFIFAATICRSLEDSTCSDPEFELEQVLKRPMNTFDDQLKAAYLPVLERLIVRKMGSRKEEVVKKFANIVGAIVILEAPLSRSSLSNLLDVNPRIINDTLQPLRSVLSIPDDSDSPIRAFHLSFREFLVDNERCTIRELCVNKSKRHGELLKSCLDILSEGGYLKRNICNLDSPGKRRREINPEKIENCLPFEVQYACRYWVHHLREANVQLNTGHQAYKFLQTHLLYWLEALSLLGRISESIGFIQELQKLVDPNSNATSLLYDSMRFILQFRAIADDAPLQLYSSALLFAPEHSIVRNLFRNHISQITLKPIIEHNWNPCLQTLEYSDRVRGPLNSVAFSSDGKLLASTTGHTITISDAVTGIVQQTVEFNGTGYIKDKKSTCFSADGRLIAAGLSDSYHIQIRDVVTGVLRHTFQGHLGAISQLVVSGDGKLMVSASRDKTVKIWDLETWTLKKTLEGHTDEVLAVTVLGDTGLIASGGLDCTVRIWDIAMGALRHTLVHHTDSVLSIAFQQDTGLMLSLSYDKTVRVWDVATGAPQRAFDLANDDESDSYVFSRDGKLIAFRPNDRLLHVWDTEKGILRNSLRTDANTTYIAFSPKGKLIASMSTRAIKIWDIADYSTLQVADSYRPTIEVMALSLDNKSAATASFGGLLKVWDVAEATPRYTLEHHCDCGSIISIAFSPDNRLIAWRCDCGTLRVCDAATGALQYELDNPSASPKEFRFSPDSQLLASICYLTTINVYDASKGILRCNLKIGKSRPTTLTFYPNSKLIASGSRNGTISCWDAVQGTLQYSLKASSSKTVSHIAFSADGKLIASGMGNNYFDPDSQILIWNTASRVLKATYDLPFGLESISFAPDTSCFLIQPGSLHLNPYREDFASKKADGTHADDTESLISLDKSKTRDIAGLPSRGYSLSLNNIWIKQDGENLLWLPPDYRPRVPAMFSSKNMIALGCASGDVAFIEFRAGL